jgi:UPF0755 protein
VRTRRRVGEWGADGQPLSAAVAHSDRRDIFGLRRARRRRRILRRLGGLAVILLLALVGLGTWYWVEAHPSGKPGKGLVVHVGRGEPIDTVVSDLVRRGVLSNSFAFRLWTLVHGEPHFSPGDYYLHRNSSFAKVSSALASGPDVTTVAVASGQTLSEIAASLKAVSATFANQFLTEAKSGAVASPLLPVPGATVEGLVGPGSYQITPGEDPKALLAKMLARFATEATKAGLTPAAAAADGLSPYQVVVLASITQKEGYYDKYMGQVARVIYNRLNAGMRLEMTSTVLYSFGQDGGAPTVAQEETTTPYNTYLHPGLTPTPICVPSPAALAAAVHPPPGSWLYFELTTPSKGVMVFSSTYTAQQAAIRQAQANARAAG